MKIGGLQKNSLIDFPNTLACVVFTSGCNFICPYCHNPELVAGSGNGAGTLIGESELFAFLEKRKNLLDGVVITGGEPTLHGDLLGFCEKIKALGYKIKLDSNGTNPQMLSFLFENRLVDFISMDIKTSLAQYHLAAGSNFSESLLSESISLVMDKAPGYEFRTTCIRPFVSKHNIKDIGEMISGASRYVLQQCSKNVTVLDPEFLKDESRFFTDQEIQELKTLLKPYIDNIITR